ncbi:MAG: MBOAT family O-acyltransferase [Anaerolineales bacterium]
MTLAHLLVFSALAPIARLWERLGLRRWLMLAGSVAAVYWLQPLAPIRNLDFWLPTASLALAIWVWAMSRPAGAAGAAPSRGGAVQPVTEPAEPRATIITGLVIAGLVAAIALMRYLGPVCCVTPSRPPVILAVLAGLLLVGAVAALLLWRPAAGRWLNVAVAALIGLLLVTKLEPLGTAASGMLRGLAGQPRDLASATDLRWLGFSYLSFRLIHVLRDRAAGRLPQVSLREFITYAVFFPAFTAGPIDRLERFVKDERQPFQLDAEAILAGGSRIAMGVLKKFVLADSLALFALNASNAAQTNGALWTWLLVYAYAWRLFLDFSGYTDIALGLGRFFGIKLPENFDRPYSKPNLTLFWNSWHISLSQWFRTYVFNPLTRYLRARPLPPALIILMTQMVVMVLIGLWHGVTWNFVIWGAWHGVGLFIHNRWADFMKPRGAFLAARPRLQTAARVGGILLTFHFVALGWVWFALPDTGLALTVFRRLFGL